MGLLLETLRSVEFLAGLSEETLLRFMVLGRSTDLAKKHVLWRAGAASESIVIPVTGEAKTGTTNEEGREFIDRFLGSGECIGLASVLDGLPHPTDCEVVRAGEFFTMQRAAFLQFLDAHPEVRTATARMIGNLYRRALKEREDTALRPVPERVAEFLVRYACLRRDDGAKVLVHATQAEIAARLGTVREVVARVFADFSARGLIERTDHGIHISDWEGLRAAAGLVENEAAASASARTRTARFFLPVAERRRHGDADEAEHCRQHLGDLGLCRERGCPGAVAAGAAPQKKAPKRN